MNKKLKEEIEGLLSKYPIDLGAFHQGMFARKLGDIFSKEQLFLLKSFEEILGEDEPTATLGQRYYKNRISRIRNKLRSEMRLALKVIRKEL